MHLHRPYCFCHDTIFTSLTCHIYYLPFCMTAMQFIQSRSAYFNFVSEWYHIEYLSTQSTIIYNWDYLYWCLWCFPWFQLAYRPLWLTALGTFSISACLSVFFGWLLWRFRWFQLAFWLLWLTALGTFSISACLLGYFGWLLWRFRWFQLAFWLLWVTALALLLILACLSASLSDCFGDFADFSLPISFFWVTALRFSLIPACFSLSTYRIRICRHL